MTTSKIILPVIAKLDSQISIQEIIGVQPMSGDVGSIFTMKYSYQDSNIAKFHKKYKFTRANWYLANFSWTEYENVRIWCVQQFGPHPKNPDAWSRWIIQSGNAIKFRDEKDYVLFLLRWS